AEWYISITPLETASKTSKGLTSSPAANTVTRMRFPVATVIARPMRSALVCSPGKSFGQLVASLNSRMPCEIAGAGNAAAAAAAAPAFTIMPRRVIGALEPDGSPSDGISPPGTCRYFFVQIDMDGLTHRWRLEQAEEAYRLFDTEMSALCHKQT